MEPTSIPLPLKSPSWNAAGYLSNAGSQRYLLEAESSTGFVAWMLADGTTLVNGGAETSLPATDLVVFWPCASYTDPSPSGSLIYFDCHGQRIVRLDVRGLTSLQYLDCSYNALEVLPLDNLLELQALDAGNNVLAQLDVKKLQKLRLLNVGNNRLTQLDLSGLSLLEVLDCSENPLVALNTTGCSSLKER